VQRQTFHFKPSRWLAVVLLAGHGVVSASLLHLDLPFWALGALLFLLWVNLGYLLWREVMLRSSQACLAMHVAEEELELQLRGGQTVVVQLCAESLVTPWLTVLSLKPQTGRWRRLVILPDSLDAESFRQLRVCLKWGYRLPA
jgi:toxin CptA